MISGSEGEILSYYFSSNENDVLRLISSTRKFKLIKSI